MPEDLLRWRPIIPMGAIPMKEGIEEFVNNPDYIAEVKYDGFRMLAHIDKGRIRFTTRSVGIESARAGNPWPTERTDNLPHLRDLQTGELYGTILDGEIWKEGCRSHDITSMVGGLPETSIANQEAEGYVTYRIYDILQYKGDDVTDWPFYKRRQLLQHTFRYLQEINENIVINSPALGLDYAALVNNYYDLSEQVPHELKEAKYTELLANGGEGMILKHKDSTYHLGKIHKGKGVPSKVKASSRNGLKWSPWVKWKKKDTFDCVVLGFSPATRLYKGSEPLENWPYWENGEPVTKRHFHGWPGAIIFGQYHNGELIEVGNTSGITEDWLQRFKDHPNDFIGNVIVVEAMERIPKTNALREPRFLYFRESWDKAPNECTIEG
jgi:ATP-dependent DNA ligase